jgi:hypothetical protein
MRQSVICEGVEVWCRLRRGGIERMRRPRAGIERRKYRLETSLIVNHLDLDS